LAVGIETIRGEPLPVFSSIPANSSDVYRLALDAPDLPFLIYQQERFTYGETYRLATRLAGALVRRGIARGDRVGICSRNTPQWCLAYMAITMIGAIVVPMNARWLSSEILYAIRDSGCRLIFADPKRIMSLQQTLGDKTQDESLLSPGFVAMDG